MRLFIAAFSLCLLFGSAFAGTPVQKADTLAARLATQQYLYPQEKLYVHTDKPYYIAGDTIWLRAYVVDAATHQPVVKSKYVYVEFQNVDKPPLGEATPELERIRIMEQNGLYAGCFPLSITDGDGNYTLTAYTAFMQNAGPDYFFQMPIHVSAYDNRAEQQTSKRNEKQDFDVAFFPEGGYLIDGVPCTLGFKALQSDGNSIDVSGRIVNSRGHEIAAFKSLHAGMGKVSFTPQLGETYFAECENTEGRFSRVQLPPARNDACVVQLFTASERFAIQVALPRGFDPGPLSLLIQCRGKLCYYKQLDASTVHLSFLRKDFPDGVLQILLLDSENRPLSERLLFCYDGRNQPQVAFKSDKPKYGRREKMSLTLDFTDIEDQPLAGDFSVSVTDNRIVEPRRSSNILTSLLLESDLKGYIEDPAFYFDPQEPDRQQAVDALMLTQGWRRYDIPNVLCGKYSEPAEPVEIGQEIAGRIRKVGLFRKRNFKDYKVSAVVPQFGHYAVSNVDSVGRFALNGFDFPNKTIFVLQALGADNKSDVELLTDEERYPSCSNRFPVRDWSAGIKDYKGNLAQFTDSLKYIMIDKIVVSGKRIDPTESPYEVLVSSSVDYKTIEEEKYGSIEEAVRSQHGVTIRGNKIWAFDKPVSYVIDGVLWDQSLDMPEGQEFILKDDIPSFIPIEMIKKIEIIPSVNAAIFGVRIMGNSVVAITTKNGSELLSGGHNDSERPNRKVIIPFGYQKPAEFYAPKYETPQERNVYERDLRTTIYWNPDIKISPEGKAQIEFYTSDNGVDYTLHVEGLLKSEETPILHKDFTF